MSAKFSHHLDKLEKAILEHLYSQGLSDSDQQFLLAQWQQDILRQLINKIEHTLEAIQDKRPLDFIHFSLLPALDDLARINGELLDEQLLNNIFSNFCIGK